MKLEINISEKNLSGTNSSETNVPEISKVVLLQLASKSPRRRELLAQLGVNFSLVDVDVPEVKALGETPEDYVLRLAQDKSLAGFNAAPGLPTLGADTVVSCAGEILEKPRDRDHGVAMLALLSGREHSVISAIAINDSHQQMSAISETRVHFREISEQQAERYWATNEPCDKAGGYAIQGCGAVFVTHIVGSYSAVVGLPIEKLYPMLNVFDIPFWT